MRKEAPAALMSVEEQCDSNQAHVSFLRSVSTVSGAGVANTSWELCLAGNTSNSAFRLYSPLCKMRGPCPRDSVSCLLP